MLVGVAVPPLPCRPLTYDGGSVCRAGQQVVHDEQKDGVAQDEGHLERGPIDAVWREVEGQDVNEHEEGAGDQQVDHVEDRAPLYDHLEKEEECRNKILHSNKEYDGRWFLDFFDF